MSDDKPLSSQEWDEQEPAPTEEELREAEALAGAVEGLLTGQPVGGADELTAASAMIRASMHEQHLAEERRDLLIQQAMQRALASRPALRRSTVRRLAPVLALAASLLLVLGAGWLMWRGAPAGRRHVGPQALSPQMLSRSSDALMGRPFADRAGASRRLDLVFADRLGGYRQVLLARGMP